MLSEALGEVALCIATSCAYDKQIAPPCSAIPTPSERGALLKLWVVKPPTGSKVVRSAEASADGLLETQSTFRQLAPATSCSDSARTDASQWAPTRIPGETAGLVRGRSVERAEAGRGRKRVERAGRGRF